MRYSKPALLLCLAGLPVLLAGCGASTYERRLAETKKYFAYLNKLDRALNSREWHEAGLSLRIPQKFDRADESDSEFTQSFAEQVPGIVGSWVAKVDGADGEEPCRLYALSNHDLYLDNSMREVALDFKNRAAETVARAVGERISERDSWKSIDLPIKAGYVERRRFSLKTLRPEEPIDGVQYEVDIYRATEGDLQALFVLMTPVEANPNERVGEKFQLSLETLDMESKAPSQSGGGSGSGRSRSTNPGF